MSSLENLEIAQFSFFTCDNLEAELSSHHSRRRILAQLRSGLYGNLLQKESQELMSNWMSKLISTLSAGSSYGRFCFSFFDLYIGVLCKYSLVNATESLVDAISTVGSKIQEEPSTESLNFVCAMLSAVGSCNELFGISLGPCKRKLADALLEILSVMTRQTQMDIYWTSQFEFTSGLLMMAIRSLLPEVTFIHNVKIDFENVADFASDAQIIALGVLSRTVDSIVFASALELLTRTSLIVPSSRSHVASILRDQLQQALNRLRNKRLDIENEPRFIENEEEVLLRTILSSLVQVALVPASELFVSAVEKSVTSHVAIDPHIVASSLQFLRGELLEEGSSGFSRMVRNQRRNGGLSSSTSRVQTSDSPKANFLKDTKTESNVGRINMPSEPRSPQLSPSVSFIGGLSEDVRSILTGALCSFIAIDLGEAIGNGEPSTAFFNSSSSAATIYELVREFVAAREFSLSSNNLSWSVLSRLNLDVSSTDPISASNAAKERALLSCSNLVSLLQHVAISCDNKNITSIISSSFLESWVLERSIIVNEARTRQRIGLPRLQLGVGQRFTSKTDDDLSGYFSSKVFGSLSYQQSDTSAPRLYAETAPLSLCDILSSSVSHISAMNISNGSDRSPFFCSLIDALGRLCILRSSGTRTTGAYADASETFVAQYIQQASRLGSHIDSATNISDPTTLVLCSHQAAIAASLTLISRGLLKSAREKLPDAIRVETESKRKDFRQRMLNLTLQLSGEASRVGKDPNEIYASLLGSVLPALAFSLIPSDDISATNMNNSRNWTSGESFIPLRSSASSVRMYRSLWLALIAHRFFSEGFTNQSSPGSHWPAVWLRAIRSIARNTPVLVVRSQSYKKSAIDTDLSTGGTSTLLPFSNNVMTEIRAQLVSLMPSTLRAGLASLPMHQVVFLRSVLALETLRSLNGSCMAPLLYLQDPTIEQEGLSGYFESIAASAFSSFATYARRLGNSPLRKNLLADHSMFFLANCAHRFSSVRSAAFRLLVDLAETFPSVLWDDDVVRVLLDAVDILSKRAKQGDCPPPTFVSGKADLSANGILMSDPLSESSSIKTPTSPYAMHVPSSMSELADILSDITELTCHWILRAMAAAPNETRSMFLRFLAQISESKMPSAGVSVALYSISPSLPSAAGPLIKPFGMSSRVRSAALATVGRAAPSLALELGLLSSADVRVRYSSSVGSSTSKSAPLGSKAVNNSSSPASIGSHVQPSSAGSSGGDGHPGHPGNRSSGRQLIAPFASSINIHSLGGFYSTAWGRPLAHESWRKRKGLKSATIESTIDEYGEEDDSIHEDDAEGNDDDSTFASVSNSSDRVLKLNGTTSLSARPLMTRSIPRVGVGRGSVTGSGSIKLTTSSKLLPAANFGRYPGSLMAVSSSNLSSEYERVSIRVPIDPLSMLGSRLGPAFITVIEKRSHYLGQIEGLAHFHNQLLNDSKSGPITAFSFEESLSRTLSAGAQILLIAAHLEWRSEVISSAELSHLAFSREYELLGSDVVNSVIGVPPSPVPIQSINESSIVHDKNADQKETEIIIQKSELGHTLYRISAFIIWLQSKTAQNEGVTDSAKELISLLVWLPVRIFSPESLSIATECWSWVLSGIQGLSSLQMRLLDEIVSAWNWTISMKLGLFSGTSFKNAIGLCDPHPSGVVSSQSIRPGSETSLQPAISLPMGLSNSEPHRIFISFLDERFKVCRWTNSEELSLIYSAVIAAANSHADLLSSEPSAFGVHMRLVHLELSVVQAVQSSSISSLPRSVMRSMRSRGNGSSRHFSDAKVGLGSIGAAIGPSIDRDVSMDFYDYDVNVSASTDRNSVHHSNELKVDDYKTPLSHDEQKLSRSEPLDVKPWPVLTVGSISALRERSLRAILRWFEFKPSRYEASTSAESVRSDFPFFVGVCRLLKSEIVSTNVGSISISTDEKDNRQKITPEDIYKCVDDEHDRDVRVDLKSELEKLLPAHRYVDYHADSIYINTVQCDFANKLVSSFCRRKIDASNFTSNIKDENLQSRDPTTARSFPPCSTGSQSDLQNIRDLCLILLGHEMDRIVAWHNPLDVDERRLPCELEFSVESIVTASLNLGTSDTSTDEESALGGLSSMWKRLLNAAWSVNPRLALSIATRFQSIRLVSDFVGELVRNDPDSVSFEPTSVVYIITEETVRENSVLLHKLHTWAAANMAIILSLLARRPYSIKSATGVDMSSKPLFCHPLVTSYVLRSLSQFSDDVIVFFLPQIVQALRHDSSSMLSEFLVELGKRSILIAEQLMWLLSSECMGEEVAEDSTDAATEQSVKSSSIPKSNEKSYGFQRQLQGRDPLPEIATNLSDVVLSTLTPLARTSIDVHYAFWDQVTNISGRLKTEVPNKLQRRTKVREFLRDLQTESERDYFYARDRLHRKVTNDDKKRPLRLAGAVRVLDGRFAKDSSQMTSEDLQDSTSLIFDITLPTNPKLRLVSVDLESGRPMQSAAKCPFRLTFQVESCSGPDDLLRMHERRILTLREGFSSHKPRLKDHSTSFSLTSSSFIDNSTMLRAQLGAQHAALVLRRRVQRKRVQVGEKLERTREIVGEGIRKQQAEIGKGVNSIVAVASHRIAQLRSAADRPKDKMDESSASEMTEAIEVPEVQLHTNDEHEVILDEDIAHAEADEVRNISDDDNDDDDDCDVIHGCEDNTTSDIAVQDSIDSSSAIASVPLGAEATDSLKRQSTLLRDSLSTIGRKLKAFHVDLGAIPEKAPPIQDDLIDNDVETSSEHNTTQNMTSCIFKVFDDCRQDALALQFMALCKESFEEAKLGLYLFPYRVIPTRTGSSRIPGGILECVPDVRSRDEIGKSGFKSLFDYFTSSFGRPDGERFECARRNLVRSLAAYAVFCYLLRVKDRHNGNLLISGQGHLVHIDFGFLLGISPGGNLGFETAAFKLTQEMVDVMGGNIDSECFQVFSELSCRAFLLARDKIDELNSVVVGMADSALPCFLFPDTLSNLRARFKPEDSDLKACKFWKTEIIASAKSVTTTLYDGIQKLQQGIAF
jgi:hypothetical protein